MIHPPQTCGQPHDHCTRFKSATDLVAYLLCAALISACAVFLTRRVLYSDSTDLGLHYAAADYIGRTRAWPPPASAVMPADNYPLLSHTIAGLLGVGIGSTLRVLLTLSILSTCLIYGVLGWATRRSDSFGLPFAVVAGALTFLFAPLNIFWGNEVISNFFFPQIIGDALFLLILFVTTTLINFRAKLILLCVSTVILDQIYTISAIHLALSAPLLWIVPILRRWRSTRQFPSRDFKYCVILAGFLSFLVASNPTFFSMITNATFNGGISVHLGNAGVAVLTVTDAGLWIALAIFAIRRRSGLKRADFVLAALTGVTGSALIQWLSLNLFGYGSNYAVSKHAFGLGTMMVIGLTTIAFDVVASLGYPTRCLSRNVARLERPACLGPSLFMILALASIWWHRPTIKLEDVETYEADARRLASTKPFSEAVYNHTISFNSQVSDGINTL